MNDDLIVSTDPERDNRVAQQICDGILKTVKTVMKEHGPDPRSTELIASGFGMAVVSLGETDVAIYALMLRALTVR